MRWFAQQAAKWGQKAAQAGVGITCLIVIRNYLLSGTALPAGTTAMGLVKGLWLAVEQLPNIFVTATVLFHILLVPADGLDIVGLLFVTITDIVIWITLAIFVVTASLAALFLLPTLPALLPRRESRRKAKERLQQQQPTGHPKPTETSTGLT